MAGGSAVFGVAPALVLSRRHDGQTVFFTQLVAEIADFITAFLIGHIFLVINKTGGAKEPTSVVVDSYIGFNGA